MGTYKLFSYTWYIGKMNPIKVLSQNLLGGTEKSHGEHQHS
jgi:hypothetical protein